MEKVSLKFFRTDLKEIETKSQTRLNRSFYTPMAKNKL